MPEPGCSCSSCRTDAKHHERLLCFFLRWGVGVAMIVDTFTLPGLPHPKPSFLLSRGWVFENFSMSAYGSLLYSRRLKLPFSAFLGIMGTWGKRRMALLHIRAPHTGDIRSILSGKFSRHLANSASTFRGTFRATHNAFGLFTGLN